MPTIDETYRANLRLLAKDAGGVGALAGLLDKSSAQVSQWLNGSKDSKTGKPRSLSRATAREIERALDKPEGWMDEPHAIAPAGDEAPAKTPGAVYEAPTQLELEFLENFRTIMDEDQQRYAEEIADKAAKVRAHMAKVLGRYGASPKPAKTAADAKKTEIARAALDITDALRQQALIPHPAGKPIKK